MPWEWPVGAACAFLVALVTTPAGVSGAVLLLPVQLSILGVPSPAVTPTNLLFNIVSGPGALLRYRHQGRLDGPLTRLLLLGTLPGVVIGAVVRVFAIPGQHAFKLVIAAVLLPLGLWLCVQGLHPARRRPARPLSDRTVTGLALIVGVVGGIYGIGGGSLLGPILVGRGHPVGQVAPAALTSTFLTSIVGAVTYTLIGLATAGDIAPDWGLGLLCGLGGLIGGYLGARLQPRLPETALRVLLGVLATALALLYLRQAV